MPIELKGAGIQCTHTALASIGPSPTDDDRDKSDQGQSHRNLRSENAKSAISPPFIRPELAGGRTQLIIHK
jgi:hypothetical protein